MSRAPSGSFRSGRTRKRKVEPRRLRTSSVPGRYPGAVALICSFGRPGTCAAPPTEKAIPPFRRTHRIATASFSSSPAYSIRSLVGSNPMIRQIVRTPNDLLTLRSSCTSATEGPRYTRTSGVPSSSLRSGSSMAMTSGRTCRWWIATDHPLSSTSTPGIWESLERRGSRVARTFSRRTSNGSPGRIRCPPGRRHSSPLAPPMMTRGNGTRFARSPISLLERTITKWAGIRASSFRSSLHIGWIRAVCRSSTMGARVPSKSKTQRDRMPGPIVPADSLSILEPSSLR